MTIGRLKKQRVRRYYVLLAILVPIACFGVGAHSLVSLTVMEEIRLPTLFLATCCKQSLIIQTPIQYSGLTEKSNTQNGFNGIITQRGVQAGSADTLLSQFLEEGGCLTSSWESDALLQLNSELLNGSATLGHTPAGSALRVVSVAKPMIYDGSSVLIEAFQSFPASTGKKPKGQMQRRQREVQPLGGVL